MQYQDLQRTFADWRKRQMDWIKVENGCYQQGEYSVEYDYEASERNAMQWNVFAMGELVSSHPTLRIGKSMVRVYQERGHC